MFCVQSCYAFCNALLAACKYIYHVIGREVSNLNMIDRLFFVVPILLVFSSGIIRNDNGSYM